MIRCIAMDLDDTLLRDDLSISPENQIAIQKAIQQGINIVLASGRMVESMLPYAGEMGLDFPLIAYNGAVIRETLSGKRLYHQPVPKESAAKVIPIFQKAGIHLNLYLHDKVYIQKTTHWSEQYAASAGVTPHPVGDLAAVLDEAPPKMLGIGTIEEIERMHSYLQREFSAELDFTKSKPNYLEILAHGVSKGRALQFLAQTWGFNRSEVMAIGDAPNDLSMVTWAGVGVAIGNATAVVREQADLLVSDNNHNGVAEAINRVVFRADGIGE
jgi:Cof subfamily protein (haloacid dehalogenase superfamily)